MSNVQKRDKAAEVALQAIMDARNDGSEYHQLCPELMLVEVARHAARLFAEVAHQVAYLQGYSRARIQHEEFLAESEQ